MKGSNKLKKFLIKSLFFAILIILTVVTPAMLIDPFNVFHWNHIRNNGVEPNKNYIKTKYILNQKDKFDGFLFGSSRVGAIHTEKIKDYAIYNMTYSCGTPTEHLETLQVFIDAGIDIDIVVMGVDCSSYTESADVHNEQPLRASYKYLCDNPDAFLGYYIDPLMLYESRTAILGDDIIEGYDAFYQYGWWCDYERAPKANWLIVDRNEKYIGKYNTYEKTLEDIKSICELCDREGIKLIIFTNPLFEKTWYDSVDVGYLSFLTDLAQITPYYNFSGINDITTDPNYFIDYSHYNAEVGDMIINVMFYGDVNEKLFQQGFGVLVTSENVDRVLESATGNNN